MVRERDASMSEVPGSILGADVQFSFFFLVEKKFDDCEKISKCRLNGTDRLRNGNVPRRLSKHQLFQPPNQVTDLLSINIKVS